MRILKKKKNPSICKHENAEMVEAIYSLIQSIPFNVLCTLGEDSTACPSLPSNTVFVLRHALLLRLYSFHSGLFPFVGVC